MREFFRGWRRKAGCVALVMACVSFTCWMRSFVVEDTFRFARPEMVLYVWSRDGVTHFSRTDLPNELEGFEWTTKSHEELIEWDAFTATLPGKRRSFLGFVIDNNDRILWVPHWSVVLPTTLLSAYLILWKPRKRPEQGHA